MRNEGQELSILLKNTLSSASDCNPLSLFFAISKKVLILKTCDYDEILWLDEEGKFMSEN